MTTLLILAAVTVAVTALVLALLWVLDVRRITHPRDKRVDYGLTDDDAPRDDNDWPPDDLESFEAWMRKKYGITP